MNFKKINLINLMPKGTRTILDIQFRNYLFNNLFNTYSKTELAKKFGGDRRSYYSWSMGKRTPSFDLILKLCYLLKINKKILFSNISSITQFYRVGSFKVRSQYLIFDSEFAEWFGLTKGDGCISKKYVECGNTKLPLVLQFAKFLENRFGIKKTQIEFTLRLPIGKAQKDFEKIISFIKQKGYTRIVITKKDEKIKRRELLYITRFNSKLLATIMSKIQKDLYFLLENSPNKVKAAFIRGYCAAEGSVGDRRVTIAQKDTKELKSIRRLLASLGFKHVSEPEKCGECSRLSIYTKKELEKFYNEISFGKHEIRNKKLKNLISSYIYDEYKARKLQYKEFSDIIRSNVKVTAPFIAKITSNDYKYTSQLLKEMVKLKMIKVIASSKPYLYLMRDSSGN